MLESSKYYHIYNRANGFENLFCTPENYDFFLRKYWQHISPIADTFCYCLMPNHIHFFIRLKDEESLATVLKERYKDEPHSVYALSSENLPVNSKFETPEQLMGNFISKQFSNLFSSYTQSLNKQKGRTGGLFQKPFKAKWVEGINYFQLLVVYIHQNPVRHGFVKNPDEWKHSSYHHFLQGNHSLSNLQIKEVLDWFDHLANFLHNHTIVYDSFPDSQIILK